MEPNRPVHHTMSVILLILINTVPAAALPDKGLDLDCTNDFERMMFCQFQAQNCSEYNLTVVNNEGVETCRPHSQQCDIGQCCCSVELEIIYGETHEVTVWRRGQSLKSRNISISDSIKPKAPRIIAVKEFNGNFQVEWTTNMKGRLSDLLLANITYHKKGDTEMVSEFVKPTTVNGLVHCKILGRYLEPSTTYVVSVKSYTNYSKKLSDSSREFEFTTSASRNALLLAIIVSLSIVAVIISGVTYLCCIKFKRKWWDTVPKCPNPKLLVMNPNEQEFLKPEPPIISSVHIEPPCPEDSKSCSKVSLMDSSGGSPQQSSGISTGSSCLSYANTEPPDIKASVQEALANAFPNISPISPLTTSLFTESNKDSGLFSAPYDPFVVRADDMNSGSSGFDNKTYSIIIPSCPQQLMMDSSEVQMEAAMVCDSAYHPSEGVSGTSADQQLPMCLPLNLPLVASSLVPTDMSYHQCNADSGRFSCADDSSLSSISSGTNTTASCDLMSRVEVGCESGDEVVSAATKMTGKNKGAIICDENPCYSSKSFPPVDDDYQPFQNLMGQLDVLSSGQKNGEKDQQLDKYPEESFAKFPAPIPSFLTNVQGNQSLSEHQRPLLALICADQSMSVITDNGYQSV
ncbi:uncharacterized protein LOC113121328 isoform X2 [Mastacembelus armatus]|uniref:uncharacterized protein LOC113121328 isoform X2 n=1 Tax=Mastacembelus armatus TaxID=205130 RepID=UPI000E45A973|nr:uncharacterized protein LOC113121328 isoform X2 [Mastacembelus armatus]